MFVCANCGNNFSRKYNLTRHLNKHFPFLRNEDEKFICDICGDKFTEKCNLNRHIIRKHACPENSTSKKKRIICPLCKNNFSKYAFYHAHLSHMHGIPLDQQELSFSSVQDFQKWKISVEKRTKSMFVQDSSSKNLSKGKVTYYFCHRSFHFIKKGKTVHQKKAGTNKIGIACSAMMYVTVVANAVHVNFCNSHIGHDSEVGRLRLSNEERVALAGKLSVGVSLSKILDDIRDEKSTERDRIHLLERSDLYNIKKSFNIIYPLWYENDEKTSLKAWVEKMKHRETKNLVRFFKAQDVDYEDFERTDLILIMMSEFQKVMIKAFGHKVVCVDGTHGTSSYDFHLFTIVVLDEYDNGVPVAFCFSNRSTRNLYKLFFSEVKKAIGQTITSDIFMSDGDITFYTAWQETMTSANKQLICQWHVNKIWNTNISKVQNVSKKELVHKTLQNLMLERDKETFHVELVNFLTQLKNDLDTNDFFQYFADNYVDNVHLWAQCYRPFVLANTDMRLEALHKAIKYDYLNGTRCIRLDATIHALLLLTCNAEHERKLKSKEQEPNKKLRMISEYHEKSSSDYLDYVQSNGEDKWVVTSRTDPSKSYDVSVIKYEPCCTHVCRECRICVHMFRCSCPENTIQQNICKHIHASVQHSERNHLNNDFADEGHQSQDVVLFFDKHSDHLPATVKEKISLEELKNEITAKCNVIQGVLHKSEVSPEQCRRILGHLDAVSSVFNENVSPQNTTTKISHSETDLFFCCTQKKEESAVT